MILCGLVLMPSVGEARAAASKQSSSLTRHPFADGWRLRLDVRRRPDFLRFSSIPVNFKGALMVPDLSAACLAEAKARGVGGK